MKFKESAQIPAAIILTDLFERFLFHRRRNYNFTKAATIEILLSCRDV